MFFDVQKASMLKRIGAWIFDLIMLAIIVVGVLAFVTAVFGYEYHTAQLEEVKVEYETAYNISFDKTIEEILALPEAEQEIYAAANEALNKDEEFQKLYDKVINIMLTSVSLSILIGYVLMEFLVPLLFGNGQTAGKKIFSIAVMRTDGVRVTPFMMFARAILGKCTIETLVPVLLIIMLFFGLFSTVALVVLVLILLLQVILVAKTQNHSAIHDLMACTVVVDVNSQMIFDSQEHRLEYRKRFEEENSTGK